MFGCNPAPPAIGLVVVLEAEFGGRIVLLKEEEDFEVTVELVLLLVRDEEVPLLLPQVFVPQSLTMTAGSSPAALRRPLASTTLEAVLSRLDDRKSAVCCLRPAIFKHKKVSFDQNPVLPHPELQDEICFVPCIQQLGVELRPTHPKKRQSRIF